MDIIDIMLARAMTPQGKTDAYVAKANAAAAKAEKAQQDAEAAIATVNAAATDITETQEAISELLENAQEVLETAQQATINMPEVYTTTGQNTDGYMTQKAVTDALTEKADTSSLNVYVTTTAMNTALASKADTSALAAKADKSYVDQQIASIPAGSGSTIINNEPVNLGSENAGKVVVVANDGGLRSSDLSESALASILIKSDSFVAEGVIGLTADYENKAFERIQEASGKVLGSDFDSYTMYGGRMRCNVADDGTINAFYGDNNYTEDGSNGQVMIYQPKFYYQRIPLKMETGNVGKIVRKESLMISAQPHSGFKIHPLFETPDHDILDYVLLPVYDGCAYDVSEQEYILNDSNAVDLTNDKLSSIAGAKPISGANHSFTIAQAEKLASNRGAGWHITTMAAESANQMLEIVEFGKFNGQQVLENGLTNISSTAGVNCSAITGSTAALGNATGHAESTIVEVNGTNSTYTIAGKRAIAYRGMENPWGNIWRFIGGVIVNGNGSMGGGIPYICNNFSYTPSTLGENYISIGFNLPINNAYVSAMGYGNENYDWVYMPAECGESANSAAPIGDIIWTVNNLSGNRIALAGGMWSSGVSSGPFYYGCDNTAAEGSYNSYSARLMYIPTKNNIYDANYQKWLLKTKE